MLQDHEDVDYPVAYYARAMTPAEKNYSVTQQEALAVVAAINAWRYMLEGQQFVVNKGK